MIKCKFLVTEKTGRDLNIIRKWIFTETDRKALESFCRKSARQYLLDTTWHYLADVLTLLPKKYPVDDKFLGSRIFTEDEDSTYIYFLYITDRKYTHQPAPISLVRDQIIYTQLNQRKKKIVEDFERQALEQARVEGVIHEKTPPDTSQPHTDIPTK